MTYVCDSCGITRDLAPVKTSTPHWRYRLTDSFYWPGKKRCVPMYCGNFKPTVLVQHQALSSGALVPGVKP